MLWIYEHHHWLACFAHFSSPLFLLHISTSYYTFSCMACINFYYVFVDEAGIRSLKFFSNIRHNNFFLCIDGRNNYECWLEKFVKKWECAQKKKKRKKDYLNSIKIIEVVSIISARFLHFLLLDEPWIKNQYTLLYF